MSFTVREPGPSDAARLAELHVSSWRETYTHLLPEGYFSPAHIQGRHDMWNDILGTPRDELTVRVAEGDDGIFGFVLVGPAQPLGEEAPARERQLYGLYVAAAHHGTGAGKALLDAGLGDGPAMLWVAAQNPRAIAFYLRNGFAFDGVEQADPAAPLIVDARMVR